MAIGLLICISYSVWIYFLRVNSQSSPPSTHYTPYPAPTSAADAIPSAIHDSSAAELWPVFAVACLIGAGSSVTLVTALAITADLIGAKSVSCWNLQKVVEI